MVPMSVGPGLTMSVKELYDLLATVLTELKLPEELPVIYYGKEGANAIIVGAVTGEPPEEGAPLPPPRAVALMGHHVPYGVKVEAVEEITVEPHPPHQVKVKTLEEIERERSR